MNKPCSFAAIGVTVGVVVGACMVILYDIMSLLTGQYDADD